jgi:phosphoribosyl 1,2-cyclic phosphodiesterase
MNADDFRLRFWGVRGSYPVPGPHTLRYGGNTTCLEVQLGRHILVIDAGTGIINLGADLVRRAREQGTGGIHVTLLLTHMHQDHTQGFPFFLPAHQGTSTLYIMGPRTFDAELESTLNHVVLPPSFPVSLYEMPSLKMIRTLSDTEQILIDPASNGINIYNMYQHEPVHLPEQVSISIHRSLAHPRNGVYIYRIDWRGKSVVFASDTEGYAFADRRLVTFAHNADVLIHDAQYTQADYINRHQGWGHSTPEMACEVARLSNAGRLILTHYEPRYNDELVAEMEQAAQALFANTTAAYEGLEVVL